MYLVGVAPGLPPMSAMGQTEKNSVRANVFRVTAESGHWRRTLSGELSLGVECHADKINVAPDQLTLPDESYRTTIQNLAVRRATLGCECQHRRL